MLDEQGLVIANNEKELYTLIFNEVESRKGLYKEGEFNAKEAITNSVWKLGLEPFNLTDKRTEDIFNKYEIYKNAPYLIDNEPFYESTILLNRLTLRLF